MKKPCIVIKCGTNYSECHLKEIVAGIEEEGVLYTTIDVEENSDPIDLAVKAANMSPVEVGIGLQNNTAVLTVVKLNNRPLFYTDEKYRVIGQNAARYVKGRPFIPM